MELTKTKIKIAHGVSPQILIGQVKNTVPFLWENKIYQTGCLAPLFQAEQNLTHLDYFKLCLISHFATVGSFVPTDVDNQIRFKLWSPELSLSEVLSMCEETLNFFHWDFTSVSTRWVKSPLTGEKLSGHHGEWFSVAVAAYGALRKRQPKLADDVQSLIVQEMEREERIFVDFKTIKDGIGLLKAATLIAHNLGDLDRVIEMWNLPEGDPLKRSRTFQNSIFYQVSKLNKLCMALENHRHFALRVPRCLRKNSDFLLPIGPFFDDWGRKLSRHPALSFEELAEIVEALIQGWEKLSKASGPSYGYPRALAGILDSFSGGLRALQTHLPSRVARKLQAGSLHNLIQISKKQFEDQWSCRALSH